MLEVLMGILRRSSPSRLLAADGFARHPESVVFHIVKEALESGIDLTAPLLSCGLIDTLIAVRKPSSPDPHLILTVLS